MKKAIFILLAIHALLSPVTAQQSVAINATGALPNASAILDVSSTSKGMLIPRMTTTQRTGILNTAVGLMVFDTNTNSFWYYQATGWAELQSTTTNPWQKSGNNIYNGNPGNVGIGLINATKKLEAAGGIKADSFFITGASAGDFLMNAGSGSTGFKKGFSGLGLNYCIAIDGIYPSRNRIITRTDAASPLGIEPFIGEIMLFAGDFPPRGYAFCNGQLLPIAQNTSLFSLIGTYYGGNGVTTFALPDLRDAVPVQQGTNWLLGESSR